MKRHIIILALLFTPACRGACQAYDRTFDGDNMIYNYEWFFDANESVKAKSQAIRAHAKMVEDSEGNTSDAAGINRRSSKVYAYSVCSCNITPSPYSVKYSVIRHTAVSA